jgi:hypothetical protein
MLVAQRIKAGTTDTRCTKVRVSMGLKVVVHLPLAKRSLSHSISINTNQQMEMVVVCQRRCVMISLVDLSYYASILNLPFACPRLVSPLSQLPASGRRNINSCLQILYLEKYTTSLKMLTMNVGHVALPFRGTGTRRFSRLFIQTRTIHVLLICSSPRTRPPKLFTSLPVGGTKR